MSHSRHLSHQDLWFLQTMLSQKMKEKVLCLIDEDHDFNQILEFIKKESENPLVIQEKYKTFIQNFTKFSHHILIREDLEFLRNERLSLHAPLAVEYRGNPQVLRKKLIGIVGSRHPTYYGRLQAQKFARQLTQLGFGIISGGAIGIDAIANAEALSHQNGASVCVIGNGIFDPYPHSNTNLFKKLAKSEQGLLLSEFESLETVKRWNFPKRNATIAELCDFLLVVEATQTSGSLMTAKFAMQCGKPVGALPGNIDNPNTAGSHILIQKGAYCIQDPKDVAQLLYQPVSHVLASFS